MKLAVRASLLYLYLLLFCCVLLLFFLCSIYLSLAVYSFWSYFIFLAHYFLSLCCLCLYAFLLSFSFQVSFRFRFNFLVRQIHLLLASLQYCSGPSCFCCCYVASLPVRLSLFMFYLLDFLFSLCFHVCSFLLFLL
jgi:hypothetical protein